MATVLVIGQGGREHTLAWALSRSSQVTQVYVAPGNGGTAWETAARTDDPYAPGAPSQNVGLAVDDFVGLRDFARDHRIDLTVVGPEVPLVGGVVDLFQEAGLRIFGPSEAPAQIEASKAFAKDFMTEQGIPTGEYFIAKDDTEARRFLREYRKPLVVKASGLAAGKGVIVCDTPEEAGEAIQRIMVDRAFGTAGEIVVLEERLHGEELSVLAFCDGHIARPMIVARDYKRALDGDKGENTGGMGAIAPAPNVSGEEIEQITRDFLDPVLAGMQALGTPYVGVLYAGLMRTDQGFKALEYNCRFGDPETQVILPLLASDLFAICNACIDGALADVDLHWRDESAVTVVCAAPGYPATYPKGLAITGVDSVENALVFHAGTRRLGADLLTDGGRVLAVTALGGTIEEALTTAYANVEKITFDGIQYRTDIGYTKGGQNHG